MNPRAGWVVKELGFTVASMVLALVGFILVAAFRPGNLSALWGRSDGILEYATSKGIQEMGLLNYNSILGFPWGQDWSHFPALDPANRIQMFLFGLIWEPVTALNLLMVVSFPLVAGLMYLALRNLRVSRVIALIGGVSLSLVGYHFDYEHPLLSNYWVIPVGIVWLSFLLNVPTYLFTRGKPRLILSMGVLTGLMIGINNPQYAFFLLILGAFALIFRWNTRDGLVGRGIRVLVFATPVVTLGLSLLVTQLTRRIPAVSPTAERSVEESYVWAGKLVSIFTIPGESPLSGNPINTRLQDALETTVWTGTTALNSAMVVVASIFVGMLALFLIFNRKQQLSSWVSEALGNTGPWAGLWLVGVLFFVTSGLGVMFAALVTPQVRSWTRIGIVLAAIALTAAAIFVDSWLRALKRSNTSRDQVFRALLLVGIAVLFLDAFLAKSPFPANAATKPALESLVATGKESLAPDCTILNVPTLAFPEAVPKGSMNAYDHLLPYLASTDWRFSYGAIKGQLGSRWTDHLAVDPATKAEQARSAGFCAMLVDRQGLDASSASLEQYVEALGDPLATAQDRWYLFALGGDPDSAQDAEIFTRPEVNYGDDFTPEAADEAGIVSRWTQSQDSSFLVWNPGLSDSDFIMTVAVTAAECANNQEVTFLVDGVERESTSLTPGERREFRIPIRVPAQSYSEVQLLTPSLRCDHAGEPSDVGVRMEDARFTRVTGSRGAVTVLSGYWPPEQEPDGSILRWGDGSPGELEVLSTNPNPGTAIFSAELQAPPCGQPQTVTIAVDGNASLTRPIGSGQALPIEIPVPLESLGTKKVEITSDFPGCTVPGDDRNLGVALRNPRLG